jgi:hypothetical protein
VGEEKFGDPLEREAVDTGAQTFFDGADRPFDLPNVAIISGDHVQDNGEEVVAEAFELIVHSEKITKYKKPRA